MASRGEINKKEIQPILSKKWEVIPFVSSIENVGTFPKVKTSDCFEEGAYPVVDQSEKDIAGYINNDELLYKGDLPIVIFGDHTRNIKYVDFPFAAGADGTKILHSASGLDSKFFYYYLKSLQIPNLGYSRHFSILKQLDVPVPSLEEQKQIAAKLDKLFTQIETIKKSTERIPELLKNFRQQILTYAVTGKLIECTSELRMLGELIDELKYGTSKKADYGIEGSPVLRIPNINNGEIDSSDLKYVPLDDKEYSQLALQEGDILVIRSNGSLSIVGQCAIVGKECENWVYAGYLIRIRCAGELLPEYLNYIFQSYQVRKQIVEKSHSMSGVNNFSADKIKQLEITWYPVEVQKQIVAKLNTVFGKLNEIEKQYNTLCEKIEGLPQTFLCKAFKGELL